MKRILVCSGVLVLLAASVAAAKDPEFKMVDGKLSIQAEAITLRQFLQYLDAATGMTSTVNTQLANEQISVRFEGLELNAAIRKSFQGRPWNWAVVNGKGVNVIDRATAISATSSGPVSAPVQTFIDTPRNEPVPPQPQAAVPFPATGPVPAPANAGATPANQPAGAGNLPPSPGGPAPPVQPFQTIGTPLGGALPGVQLGK